MKQYLFIFGNHPLLSLIELKSVVEKFDDKIVVELICDNIAQITTDNPFDCVWWQNKLGGTVKIAEKVASTSEELVTELIKQHCEPQAGKFMFGISSYNLLKTDTNKMGMEVKRSIASKGTKVRFVVSKEKVLSSVIVKKNRLLSNGAEFILFKKNNDVYLAITRSVQDFEAFGERDFGRPAADAKNGMLPPKLAKIMINLATADADDVLLDPFCGSGTVIQEALLMGYKKIYGSDINERAINNTKININWLAKKNPLININEVSIKQANALELTKQFKSKEVNAVITEPYLGPVNQSGLLNKETKVLQELENVFYQFVEQVTGVIKSNGKLVVVVPIIAGRTFNYKKALADKGWLEIFPANYSVDEAKYSRNNQRVERLILVAKKS